MRVRIIRASARLSAKSDVIDRARARRNCQPISPPGDFPKEAAHLGGRSISARMGGRQLATSGYHPGERNRLLPHAKQSRNSPGPASSHQREDLEMLTLKAIALVLGAGFIFTMYSGDLSADVILAIVACLS
jgi:hypothetical protein